MIHNLNIFTNIDSRDFFNQLLPKYSLDFKSIKNLKNENSKNKNSVIFFNKNGEGKIDLQNLKGNFLLLTNENINKSIISKNIKILKTPLTPSEIKNQIEKFLVSNEIQFKDIVIVDKKITNILNKKSCYLTEIENDIVFYLIKNNNPNKKYIRENILNIKNDIETNSIESHLSRIRKKFDKIKTKIVVQAKKEDLLIS